MRKTLMLAIFWSLDRQDAQSHAYATQLVVSMEPTFVSINKGQLTSLRPTLDGGIVYTAGRCGESLLRLLGVAKMPILMRNSRLEALIMWESTTSDVLARSRQRACILSGQHPARWREGNGPNQGLRLPGRSRPGEGQGLGPGLH